MFKFVMSTGLLVGSMVGMAGVAEAKAPTPLRPPTPGLEKAAASADDDCYAVGPFETYAAAYATYLNLYNLGHDVTLPYRASDGYWYFDDCLDF